MELSATGLCFYFNDQVFCGYITFVQQRVKSKQMSLRKKSTDIKY